MVAVARNRKECMRRDLVATGFAWRPLPRAFKLTRFRIQPTRKKHTDRVFLSIACEPLDPDCEPLDPVCRLKPSMVHFVHEVYLVFVVALSTVLASSTDVALSKKYMLIIPVERATTKTKIKKYSNFIIGCQWKITPHPVHRKGKFRLGPD